ncbi:MAG TPA: HAD-IA family hydrolase [Alphaproteobacteria bacterium]|jgi:putative hydrolase of the HAD superfamily|nr:HAD-IA family hydrolase [Alphaproteobacteria bacterium]
MINFVYFDVGGVVIKDFSGTNNWEELQKEIGIKPEDYQKFDDFWDKYPVDTTCDVETLKPFIKEEFGVKFPENYSLLIDGFVNRFEVNKSIWSTIEQIKGQTKIGLLTNMYPNLFSEIEKRKIMPEVKWDVIIDSSVVKLAKPDRKIFELAEKESDSKGKEILFVENSLGHVKAAQDFGWQTFLYDSKNPEKASKDLLECFEENKHE